jgi:hypothetical protein
VKRFLAGFLAALLWASPSLALTPGQKIAVLNGVQGWSLPSSADLFFSRNGGSCAINRISAPCASQYAVVRASQETCLWSDGHASYAANNAGCITDLGFGIWQASTNQALYARDMTQTAWVKVNITAALTATGLDNAANSASTLTAGAANGTILQTLTIVSQAENYSVYCKRITGTGTINITENGGTAWAPIVLTSAYQRFNVEATLANPVIGIQIVTSGDAIACDFNQDEELAFPTPPIPTTTVAVARAADGITLKGAALTAVNNAQSARFVTNQSNFGGTAAVMLNTAGNQFLYFPVITAAKITGASSSATATIGNSGTIAGLVKSAFGMGATLNAVANGGTPATSATSWGTLTPPITLGIAGTSNLNGNMLRVTFSQIFNQFATMTTGSNPQ